jgi:hypothetical protein
MNATRALVLDTDVIALVINGEQDGETTILTSLILGPADALRLASELLNAARRRMGRP